MPHINIHLEVNKTYNLLDNYVIDAKFLEKDNKDKL